MQVKIALINPFLDPETEYGDFKVFCKTNLPKGIGFLAGYLRSNGYTKVGLFDEQISSLNN